MLQEFLVSEDADDADSAIMLRQEAKDEEEAVLAQVCTPCALLLVYLLCSRTQVGRQHPVCDATFETFKPQSTSADTPQPVALVCSSAAAAEYQRGDAVQVKAALGAKHVIRVCSSEDKGAALAAARRLVREAPAIRALVDLTNASIAIDDCYQVRTVLCVTRVLATCVPRIVCKLAGPALLVDLANTPAIKGLLRTRACATTGGPSFHRSSRVIATSPYERACCL